jgi:hypothetical protein
MATEMEDTGEPATGPGSVTSWLSRLKDGEIAALGPILERDDPLLVRYARPRLRRAVRGYTDASDVVHDVLASFAVRHSSFPQLDSREELGIPGGQNTERRSSQ